MELRFVKSESTFDGETQFGRALTELNIDIICANSPQAKGRVEGMNKSLQDRLVKELRLRGICSMEDGNAFLLEYTEDSTLKKSQAHTLPSHASLSKLHISSMSWKNLGDHFPDTTGSRGH
jgi:hypothetical protein